MGGGWKRYCKIRQAAAVKDKKGHQQGKDKHLVLTAEDLAAALREVGLLEPLSPS
jgi:hypothetical protein